MTDFADADPQSWLDDSRVLVVRVKARNKTARMRGVASEARQLLSSMLLGVSVIALGSFTVSSSGHIVRSNQVANTRSDDGVSNRYWSGLARALDQAPEVQDHEESVEVAPLL